MSFVAAVIITALVCLTEKLTRSTANILCVVRSAQPPLRSGTGIWETSSSLPSVGYGVSVWLNGAMVCLLAAPRVQLSINHGNGWPQNALRTVTADVNQQPFVRS